MKALEAVKTFFERADKIAPGGGRKVTNQELIEFTKGNPGGGMRALAELAAAELGVQLND